MKTVEHNYDFVVVGAGLAGIAAAVTAARKGIKTALVQDRPVLGGNASTEIRVPPVGATQCNFAYSRETGIIEELFLNNLLRNPTWSSQGWNTELENLVRNEPNIDLYLNTAVSDVNTKGKKIDLGLHDEVKIVSVKAYCAMAETWFVFNADYFADCSGDGIVGVQAGAIFRYGVESFSEFNEPFCPQTSNKETMGMSLQLRAKDTGRPIPFVRPNWVNLELQIEDFGPYRPVNEHFFPDTGGFWWLEWGGELDTVHDTLKIKDEVQRITLAVWDYLKNRSPLSERLATYELDWMGAVPGKRESRRFEGDHILTMGDIDQQVDFEDSVAYGGWGFDHHPPGGFHDKENPSTHQYLRGPHNIPLRSLYSRNVSNLFFAGRNISASHYALSSTRVMLTCSQLGEAVGMAAAHACNVGCNARDLSYGKRLSAIQHDLIKADHHIHNFVTALPHDIAPEAKTIASSVYSDHDPVESWGTEPLVESRMQMLSILTDHITHVQILLDASGATEFCYSFMQGPSNSSTYPDKLLFSGKIAIFPGERQWVNLPIPCTITQPGWHFLVMEANALIRLHVIESPPGQLRYYPRPEDPIRPNPHSKWTLRTLAIGQKRAADADGASVSAPVWNEHAYAFQNISCFLGFSFACRVFPLQPIYEPAMVINQKSRPTNLPNLWVSSKTSFAESEWIALSWDRPRDICGIQVLFDSSLHFHFGQSWQGYAETAIPTIVRAYAILATLSDGQEVLVARVNNNHQRNCAHSLDLSNVIGIRLECSATHGAERAQIYAVRVFEKHDSNQ